MILQPKPVKEQPSSARQTKQERVATEVDRVHEIMFRQIKEAKILLTIDEITALSPIRIRLGYHRMAPPTTKLAMADTTLVWPLGILSVVPVVVEGVPLIVSFQVIDMEDLEYTQLILGRTWQKGAKAIIDMDEEVIHIRAGTNLTTVKWSGVAKAGAM
ncbi:hypothetical protein R1flu_010368 [Riccia fluitans]|uniref:Uncharacterized protein n=1 Tax=Riccia fluitans TaxID=41844 RepID=A0ABD1Z541_9MARC